MNGTTDNIVVQAAVMQNRFEEILLKNGFTAGRASELAAVFTANSVDGVYTHGVNRFARFIGYTQKGFVNKDAKPEWLAESDAWRHSKRSRKSCHRLYIRPL